VIHRTAICLVAALAILPQTPGRAQDTRSARATVERSIEAMGGAALRSLQAVSVESIGHRYAIEQSERPEGPWIAWYTQTDEIRDHQNGRLRTTSTRRWIQSPAWVGTTLVVSDGVAAGEARGTIRPAGRSALEAAAESLALAPERLLLTALEAADLSAGAGASLYGVPQDVVTFGHRDARLTLYLDRFTHLPTALDVVRADNFGIWGMVTERRHFSLWTLEKGGLRLPRQVATEWNGVPLSHTTAVKLDVNPEIPADRFAIPEDVRAKFAAQPAPPATGIASMRPDPAKAIDVVEGVTMIPGAWHVVYVKQPDGVVIIEAPITSAYSAAILEEAERRFPGVPVRGVISTSDAWPHIGGVREYVARGIPVYALDLNLPILERLLKAPYGPKPDRLANAPRAPEWRTVTSRITIGEGPTRLEVMPLRGENGERMLMVYFPAHRLLYAADEIQRQRDGTFFMPMYLTEVRDAIVREKLEVDTVMAMHLTPTSWKTVLDAIDEATR